MRYRAAAVVLALAAAVAIGQVPMYSDYPWGLVNNGVDQGPVWNLDCKPPLWCSVPSYGNGQVQLGDGGVLPITVAFASDAGQALLAGFATYAADAGLANRSSRADFADDAGFAIFAGDAGRAYLSNFSDYASDAGYSQAAGLAGVATYALDAGLASKANVADFARDAGSAANADFARDAGSAANADLATYALDAGLAVAALWAGDAGLSIASLYAADAGLSDKALVSDFARDAGSAANADFARDAGSAANADFARDAGSAASADLATFALDAGRSVFAGFAADAGLAVAALYAGDAGLSVVSFWAADAGNLQCTTCVDAVDIASGAVTTAKLGAGAVTSAKLDDGPAISAYDEATVAGVSSRSTATNCTEGAWDGVTGYIRFTVNTVVTNPQVSTTVYTGTSTNALTTTAVVRYRLSGGFTAAPPSVIRAINNANTAQTADAAFVTADGNWHTATFDISGWTTTGTLRVDLLMPSTLATTGNWDISYIGTGVTASGTGALVSYQGAVGIGNPTPGNALSIARNSGTAAYVQTLSGTNSSLFGNGAGGETIAGSFSAQPFLLYSNSAERARFDTDGMLTVNKAGAGKASVLVSGVDTVYQAITTTSNTSSSFPQLQIVNYGANGGQPVLGTYNSRGTAVSPSALLNGDALASFIQYGRGSSAFAEGSRIESVLTAAPSTNNLTAALRFLTTNAGTSAERLRIAANGVVSLPSSGSLQVGNATWTTNANDIFLNTSGASVIYLRPNGAGSTTWQYEASSSSTYHRWLGASGAELARLTGTGLGVGGTASVRLHTFATNENLRMEGTDPWASFYQSGTRKGWWGYGDVASTTSFSLVNEVAAGAIRFDTNGGAYRFVDFNGGGTTTASINNTGDLIRTVSDERLKENVEDLPRGLGAVLQMRPVRFQWRNKDTYGDRWDIGFIAQEMISCVPEAVSRNPDGMYSLDYQKLVAVVVSAIQELFDDRTWMARRIQELEDRAQKAEERLSRLEALLGATDHE